MPDWKPSMVTPLTAAPLFIMATPKLALLLPGVMVKPLPSRVERSSRISSVTFWFKVQVLLSKSHVPTCEQSPPVASGTMVTLASTATGSTSRLKTDRGSATFVIS